MLMPHCCQNRLNFDRTLRLPEFQEAVSGAGQDFNAMAGSSDLAKRFTLVPKLRLGNLPL